MRFTKWQRISRQLVSPRVRHRKPMPHEPEIEDCAASIKTESIGLDKCLVHNNELHLFGDSEVALVQTKLLNWYDRHRRKLPWRGDPPPYLSTAEHTKGFGKENQRTTTKSKKATTKITDLFAVRQIVESVKTESEATSALSEDNTENQMQNDQKQTIKQEQDQVHVSKQRDVTPYQTWVSEIMCQQTRVDTVVEYFTRWMQKFPTIAALAAADEEQVNAMWAGLGYYRRARMLHAGARYVMKNFNGELPSTVEKLLTIPGIGRYTAGAIASIAFDKQTPLVDGNVIRVIARLRSIGADPKHKPLIDHSWKQAQLLVTGCARPGDLNQALMELGATICTTQTASCTSCPVRDVCLSSYQVQTQKHLLLQTDDDAQPIDLNLETISSFSSTKCTICDWSRSEEWPEAVLDVCTLPLRAKKNATKNESFSVGVITSGEAPSIQFLMTKRPPTGLLAGQLEFVHISTSKDDKILPMKRRQSLLNDQLRKCFVDFDSTPDAVAQRSDLGTLAHVFSHVTHHMGIEHVQLQQPLTLVKQDEPKRYQWMTLQEIKQVGITTGVQKILNLVLNHQEPAKINSKSESVRAKPATKKRGASSSKSSAKRTRTASETSKMKPLTSFFKP